MPPLYFSSAFSGRVSPLPSVFTSPQFNLLTLRQQYTGYVHLLRRRHLHLFLLLPDLEVFRLKTCFYILLSSSLEPFLSYCAHTLVTFFFILYLTRSTNRNQSPKTASSRQLKYVIGSSSLDKPTANIRVYLVLTWKSRVSRKLKRGSNSSC